LRSSSNRSLPTPKEQRNWPTITNYNEVQRFAQEESQPFHEETVDEKEKKSDNYQLEVNREQVPDDDLQLDGEEILELPETEMHQRLLN